jgi:hypothetical protein
MDSSLQYMGASTVALEERGGVLAAASPRDWTYQDATLASPLRT